MAFATVPVHADRLIYQRGTVLYTSDLGGRNVRRLFSLGSVGSTLWAVSPSGERLAYVRRGQSDSGGGLQTHPAVLSICDVSGRDTRRVLTTGSLRDRQGRSVRQIAPVGLNGTTTELEDWNLVSLAWSADGRTLYFGCTRFGTRDRATLPVDAETGTAIVDNRGRWRVLAPMTFADARDSLVVGAGRAVEKTSGDGTFAPLLLLDLAENRFFTIAPIIGRQTSDAPVYGSVLSPSLAPDGRRITFAATIGGLWMTDTEGLVLYRLQAGYITRAIWAENGRQIFFLAVTQSANGAQGRPALYRRTAPVPDRDPAPSRPSLVLTNVDRFDVVRSPDRDPGVNGLDNGTNEARTPPGPRRRSPRAPSGPRRPARPRSGSKNGLLVDPEIIGREVPAKRRPRTNIGTVGTTRETGTITPSSVTAAAAKARHNRARRKPVPRKRTATPAPILRPPVN